MVHPDVPNHIVYFDVDIGPFQALYRPPDCQLGQGHGKLSHTLIRSNICIKLLEGSSINPLFEKTFENKMFADSCVLND